jgi:hypothetical protein
MRLALAPLHFLALSIALSGLGGCAGNPQQHTAALVQEAGLQPEQVATPAFLLSAYVRITRPDRPISIYIEGDGYAWRNRYQPSTNPTPKRALGLTLAAADRSDNVVYLARPCQFTAMADNPRCEPAYWTGKRFAPEVITALDAAISHYASRTPGQHIHITGYSGGAAIAVLIAAQRQDIATLRTVAGNLDHDTVNRWHQVSLMPESLNPINVAAQVARIPQIHFSGADDKIVPLGIAQTFASRAGACARVHVVGGLPHEGNWAEIWPQLLMLRPSCMT